MSDIPPKVDSSSYLSPVLVIFVISLLAITGCAQLAGPTETDDEELTQQEVLQRQRLIEPLGDIPDEDLPEELRGPNAPTLMEFYVDEQGQIRVEILPYLLVDPTPGPPEDPEGPDLEQPVSPDREPTNVPESN